MSTITYINGQLSDEINVADRGFMYGDGLFETILACQANLPLWEYHFERLASGCQRLQIPVPSSSEIRQLLAQHLDSHSHQIIKIIVTRGQGQRGYRVMTSLSPNIVVSISERQFKPEVYWDEGISVFQCQTRIATQPALAGIKHLNRLEQVLASTEWDEGYQEGLMCTQDEYVIEATSHNFFVVRNGEILTPDLSTAGVAGIMRRYVIELASEMGIPVYIQNIKLTDMPDMHEVFLTNSIDGVWPVTRIGAWSFECGELTRKLQTRVAELIPFR